jgi:NAD(P)-dependent dehydrogenase (short-subunit alcohol dehydrogenase family)
MTDAAHGTVLVTGTSSGIGLATAVAAARAGFTTVATVRDVDRAVALRDAVARAQVKVDILRLDVTDADSVETGVRTVVERYGRLDALVNNAGVGHLGTVELTPLADLRAVMEVDFFGAVAMTRAAMPHLRASGGRVITIGAVRGVIGQPFNEAYSAAKFAVEGFMEALAPVAARVGVRVSIVEPGAVDLTSFADNAGGGDFPALIAAAGPYEPALRAYGDWVAGQLDLPVQTPPDIAEVVLRALTDPEPPFRIPTNDWARGYLGLKLADHDGMLVQAMTRRWVSPQ